MTKGLLTLFATAPLWAANVGQSPNGPSDPVSELNRKGVKLEFKPGRGYLESVLKALKIDPDSQVLVFSKSSLQSEFIGRRSPRALYFNEHTYVGWVPGAPVIEIMSVDPVLGAQFYTVLNTKPMAKVEFETDGPLCFRCHGGRTDGQAASLLVQSSHVPESGYPRAFTPSIEVTHQTPISKRWGGWYVTGTHGSMRHMGNVVSTGTDANPKIDSAKGANITNLSRFFNVKPYLTPHSDIVALMVMEQQMAVQNAISQTGLDIGGGRPATSANLEPLVRALLSSGEAPLTAPVKGTSGFAASYAKTAPVDGAGRSLSQLDLNRRLQKYPCSPLIYSASFRSLPPVVKNYIWTRFREIFEGRDQSEAYRHLSPSDRAALKAILMSTHSEFRAFMNSVE